jgi:hypothetical protein
LENTRCSSSIWNGEQRAVRLEFAERALLETHSASQERHVLLQPVNQHVLEFQLAGRAVLETFIRQVKNRIFYLLEKIRRNIGIKSLSLVLSAAADYKL